MRRWPPALCTSPGGHRSTPWNSSSDLEYPGGQFVLWLILLILCWPLALLALILYPLVWLLMLPFRLIGVTTGGVYSRYSSLC
jgi:hypothetical protein